MTETITIMSQKGGTGKTTTTQNLLAGFTLRGYKALAIDLDQQRNLTLALKADTDAKNIIDVLAGDTVAKDAVQKTKQGDLIRATKDLAKASLLLSEAGKEYRLKEKLEDLNYDYILIDTPPALDILTINALTACDSVLIPQRAELFSLEGFIDLCNFIKPIKAYYNKDLFFKGLFFTQYNARTNNTKMFEKMFSDIATGFSIPFLNTKIRNCTAIQEAQAKGQSVFEYAPKSNASIDYNSLIEELTEASNGK